MLLLNDFEEILKKLSARSGNKPDEKPQEWLRSKSIRNILNISPASLVNLRISGKVRFRKLMGSYYYNRFDLEKLFEDDTNY